jgi:hypothetical protein
MELVDAGPPGLCAYLQPGRSQLDHTGVFR